MSATAPLCLTGSATLAGIPAQRDQVRAALAGQDRQALGLDLSGVEQADVTLVQLVLTARALAARQNRGFGVSAWSEAASSAFARAGVPPESLACIPSRAD